MERHRYPVHWNGDLKWRWCRTDCGPSGEGWCHWSMSQVPRTRQRSNRRCCWKRVRLFWPDPEKDKSSGCRWAEPPWNRNWKRFCRNCWWFVWRKAPQWSWAGGQCRQQFEILSSCNPETIQQRCAASSPSLKENPARCRLLTRRLRPFSGTRNDRVATKCGRMTANWSALTPLGFQREAIASRVGRSVTGCKDYWPTVDSLNRRINGLDFYPIS